MTQEERDAHYDETKHVRYEVLVYYPEPVQYACEECKEIAGVAQWEC